MNNTFSLRRTLLYARKHYAENARLYLYGLLGTLFLLIVLAWFYGSWRKEPGTFRVSTIFLMMAFYYYFVRLSCRSHYERKSMATVYTLPVTAAEKYLFIWFNTTVVATAVFSLLLWPVTTFAGCPGDNIVLHMVYPSWLALFLIQAGLLLACCWGKEYPMKHFLVFAAAFILFLIVYFALWKWGDFFCRVPFSEVGVLLHSDTADLSYRLPGQLSSNVAYTIIFGYWILVSWLTGYFKFKERTLK